MCVFVDNLLLLFQVIATTFYFENIQVPTVYNYTYMHMYNALELCCSLFEQTHTHTQAYTFTYVRLKEYLT